MDPASNALPGERPWCRMFRPSPVDSDAPMLLFSKHGAVLELPYDDSLLGFEHAGFCVRYPLLCEEALIPVDPVSYYGFREFALADERQGLRLDLSVGGWLFFTDITGARIPSGRYFMDGLIGRYSSNGRLVAVCSISDIPLSE